jgi:hypothetical protein
LRPERWRRHGFGMKSHIAILPCWVLCVVSVGCEFDFELNTDMHSDFVFLTLLCQRYQHDMQTGRSDAAWVIHANPTYKAGDAQHGAPDAMGPRFLLVRMSHGSAVPMERVCAHSCRQLVHGTDTCLALQQRKFERLGGRHPCQQCQASGAHGTSTAGSVSVICSGERRGLAGRC